MQNLHNEAVAAPIGAASKPPDRLELAMMDIAEAAREGLLAMSVAAGMAVMHELMEEEVSALAGPKGAHDPRRVVYRHGHEDGQVTLGARRVKIRRPRIRKKRGGEAEVQTYSRFTSRDLLGKGVLDRMLAGISTRRFKSAGEPVGQAVEEKAVSTSKSAVSREFVTRTRDAMKQLMSRDLADVRLAALMIDGLDLRGRTVVGNNGLIWPTLPVSFGPTSARQMIHFAEPIPACAGGHGNVEVKSGTVRTNQARSQLVRALDQRARQAP